jgi:hypothetical protein
MGIPCLKFQRGGRNMPAASIKNEKTYEELRRHGDSKQKAAPIAKAKPISTLRNS